MFYSWHKEPHLAFPKKKKLFSDDVFQAIWDGEKKNEERIKAKLFSFIIIVDKFFTSSTHNDEWNGDDKQRQRGDEWKQKQQSRSIIRNVHYNAQQVHDDN